MRKLLALLLAAVMMLSLTACSSEEATQAASEEQTTEAPATEAKTEAPATEAPTTEAPTTEAPTTEAPTTEAPTTEAPTTEAASQSGEVNPDKAAFYADFKNNVGKFSFVGEDVRVAQSYGEGSGAMEMVMAHNMARITVPQNETDYFAVMYEDEGKLYVQTFLPAEGDAESKEEWYVADIPEGEDPLADFAEDPEENYTFEDNMTLEYLDTVEMDGVKYDRVKVTTVEENGESGEGIFWFEESGGKIQRIEMDRAEEESGVMIHARMEFFTNEDVVPAPSKTPEKISYEDATMTFAMGMMGLMYGQMEIED